MKRLILTACTILLSISMIQAQETEEKKDKNQKKGTLLIELQDEAEPDIYVDGKIFDFPLELLDQSIIESISVIKDEQAMKEYNAPNGVLLIKTKKKTESIELNTIRSIEIRDEDGEKAPKIIIDGKASGMETLENLAPDDIESISIVKGEKAIEKYNAPNGVVLVTTKKGKKKSSK